ncbi:MAG: hypothetical protein O2838_02450 [Proteobacteria bacterium]|nr:hypothetical protein [Pseudomonadota bacterium]
MQVVIQKTLLTHSGNRSIPEIVSIGDNAVLVSSSEGKIGVFYQREYRFMLFFKRTKRYFLGYLDPDITLLIDPAIKAAIRMRVRIVDRLPAHMSELGKETVCVSVWAEGDQWDRFTKKLHEQKFKAATPIEVQLQVQNAPTPNELGTVDDLFSSLTSDQKI